MNTNGPALIVPPSPPSAAAETNLTLQGVHPPVEIVNYWFWLWLALGLIAAGVAIYYLWKYWGKRALSTPPPPPVPPHVRARRRLEEALGLIDDPKPFTVAVSDAIRQYLEQRFELRAPERTTEEFLYELQGAELLTPDQKQSLGEFLVQCDMVKFARYEPMTDELRQLHAAAVRLVSETEPSPMEANPPKAPAAA
jgi:hypothetical protein